MEKKPETTVCGYRFQGFRQALDMIESDYSCDTTAKHCRGFRCPFYNLILGFSGSGHDGYSPRYMMVLNLGYVSFRKGLRS